ncbi:hypothetical protein PSACC_03471 [Paramicrosporidium saccamoebae]|uniref:Uncharacterized protein n=1 Tax=Paramicrosporidium saccamoebae TaxID=1246581 RepID=A0A2H9TG63_9FUNG|nr:hypothetical protein PSACC_03471 [Paramicrosporidium saccamoebae]
MYTASKVTATVAAIIVDGGYAFGSLGPGFGVGSDGRLGSSSTGGSVLGSSSRSSEMLRPMILGPFVEANASVSCNASRVSIAAFSAIIFSSETGKLDPC